MKTDEKLSDIEMKVYLQKVENVNEEDLPHEQDGEVPKLSIHDIPDDRPAVEELAVPNKGPELKSICKTVGKKMTNQTTPALENATVSGPLPSSVDSPGITELKAELPAVEASAGLVDGVNADSILTLKLKQDY